jgi:outer membrane protein assembly factor BamD (BamD/ComL family)
LAAERAVIERARSALARGDGQGALVAVAQHQRDFPSGQLSEEREALAVQALATAGRAQEAAERGARFRKTFPNSLLLPLVERALR